jgi:hypothetical protein
MEKFKKGKKLTSLTLKNGSLTLAAASEETFQRTK